MPLYPPSYACACTPHNTSPPLIYCMHHFAPPCHNVWMKHCYTCTCTCTCTWFVAYPNEYTSRACTVNPGWLPFFLKIFQSPFITHVYCMFTTAGSSTMVWTTTTRTIAATSTPGTPTSCGEITSVTQTATADPSPYTRRTIRQERSLLCPVASLLTAGLMVRINEACTCTCTCTLYLNTMSCMYMYSTCTVCRLYVRMQRPPVQSRVAAGFFAVL